MDYADLDAHSLYSIEREMSRYCAITEREYKVTWRHLPSHFLNDHFKVYVN